MVTYIATLLARPGHELEVSRFYQELEPLLREAKGFHGRNVYRARPGTVEAEVRRVTPPAELAAQHADSRRAETPPPATFRRQKRRHDGSS